MKSTYTLEEIKKLLTEAKPLFICLSDSEGSKIIPYNIRAKEFPKEHLQKIIDRLKARLTPDGIYHVCYSESNAKGNPGQIIKYAKGKVEQVAEVKVQEKIIVQGGDNSKLIELIQENANLKAELSSANLRIESLEQDVEELEDEVAELENKAEDKPLLGDGMQTKMNGLLDIFMAKMAEPTPPKPIAEKPAAAPQLTYESLLHLLRASPELVSKLSQDLQPTEQHSDNGQQNPG